MEASKATGPGVPVQPAAASAHDAPKLHPHPVFATDEPQMSGGERAALEGVLCRLQPRLAIEIGSAEGASLGLIAAHAGEVHSFDLFEPVLPSARLAHVKLHTGDSHELLPRVLADFARAGRDVDFVLVDGDHSAEGARRDIEDLLDSPALADATILVHDTGNPTVRRGLEAVDYAAYAKVTAVDLDWIAGYIFCEPHFRYEVWGGLGAIVVAADRPRDPATPVMQDRYVPIQPLLERGARSVAQGKDRPDGPAQPPGARPARTRAARLAAGGVLAAAVAAAGAALRHRRSR